MPNSLPQAVRQYFDDMQKNMHTCIPGTIKSFDASNCTATVQPSGKFKKPNGEFLDYPEVTEVPVCLIQSSGQDATIAYPIKEDDGCLIFFSEQQLDGWRDDQTPDTELSFDLSNGIAVVGLFSKANDVIEDACNDDAIIVDKENTRVVIKKQEINVLIDKDSKDTEITATNDKVYVKRGGTQLEIQDGKVTIKSTTIAVEGNLEVTGYVAADGVIHSAVDVQSSTASLVGHGHANLQVPATPVPIPSPKGV